MQGVHKPSKPDAADANSGPTRFHQLPQELAGVAGGRAIGKIRNCLHLTGLMASNSFADLDDTPVQPFGDRES